MAGELFSFGRIKDIHTAFIVADSALEKIDELIGKIKNLEGFEVWLKQASTAKGKGFLDILFELYCFDSLNFTQETITLKPKNSEGREVEALLKTDKKVIYIEMLNMTQMLGSLENRVNKFFEKARKKFTDKNGILFIDVSKFNNTVQPSSPVVILSPDISKIKDKIIRRFNDGSNERIEAIVLVNISWVTNPLIEWKTFFDKRFILIPKPKHKGGSHSKEFWNGILRANEFYIEDN